MKKFHVTHLRNEMGWGWGFALKHFGEFTKIPGKACVKLYCSIQYYPGRQLLFFKGTVRPD
jgi:hypothetical protein